jgi:alpha-1,6-mannosyltransferase
MSAGPTFGAPSSSDRSRGPTAGPAAGGSHLVDATMLFAPRSGGVKRYLLAKRAWLAANRPELRHTLVVPGRRTGMGRDGVLRIASTPLPFGDGYRWPASVRKWTRHLTALDPSIIEAGDPYGPGHAAIETGESIGVPVVGFCHSDPAALAALHFGEWAEKPVFKAWSTFFKRFDRVVAPSRHIADRLADAGITRVTQQPLGVDTTQFHPACATPPASAPSWVCPPIRGCSSSPAAPPRRRMSTCSWPPPRGSAVPTTCC